MAIEETTFRLLVSSSFPIAQKYVYEGEDAGDTMVDSYSELPSEVSFAIKTAFDGGAELEAAVTSLEGNANEQVRLASRAFRLWLDQKTNAGLWLDQKTNAGL